jgi:hypothetical protein
MSGVPAGPAGDGPVIGPPRMTPAERALFDRILAEGPGHYLEFGTGGSTLLAIRAGARSLVAVDSDPAWLAALATHPEVAPAIAAGRASLLHGDIGPTGDWGKPLDRRQQAGLFPNYLRVAWEEVARRGTPPDLVFVDGRFRVACCLSALLGRPEGAPPPRLLIHDLSPGRRERYARLFDHLEVVQAAGTLHELRPRADAAPARMLADLLRQIGDPA